MINVRVLQVLTKAQFLRVVVRVVVHVGFVVLLNAMPSTVFAQDAPCPPVFDERTHTAVTDADVQHVRIELDVDPAQPPASGRAVLTLRTTESGADSVRLVTSGANISEIFSSDLNEPLPFRHVSRDTMVVDLSLLRDSLLVARDSISLEFAISDVAGIQHVDGFAWTIDPLLVGGAWYPWSGDPADRFTSELLVTVPPELLVSASGRRLAERTTEDGRTTFLFTMAEPHAAGAMLFAAGPFVAGSDDGLVTVHHPGSLVVSPATVAGDALARFQNSLGHPYPYGRLSVVVVPGAAPAVAGNGIVLLSDRTVGELGSAEPTRAAVEIASGVAHQWFGGAVSAAEWKDLWLPKALSTYLAARFVEDAYGDAAFKAYMRGLATEYRVEAQLYQRPVGLSAANHPADLNDAHARSKAPWIVHSLFHSVGAEPFGSVLGRLIASNRFGTISIRDLGDALEAATGGGRDEFIRHWIHSPGFPELSASYVAESDTLSVTIEQQQIGTDVPEVYPLDLGIEVGTLDGSERFNVQLRELRQTFALPFSSEPRYVAIDPDARYLMDVAMEQSLSAWIAQLRNASTPDARHAAAIAVARRRGDPAVLLGLRSALRQPEADPSVKAGILRVIAELSDSEAAQRAVLSAYEDTSWVVRASALQVLAAYPGSAEVEQLALDAANKDPVDAVQASAVELLGRIGSDEALPVAQAALITPSRNSVIRRAGLRVFGMMADTAGDAAIQAATTHSEAEHPLLVRLEAVEVLAKLAAHTPRAANRLLELVDAPDWQLRLAAAEALLQVGNDAAVRARLETEPVSVLRARLLRLLECR